jgi:hypothetical protein
MSKKEKRKKISTSLTIKEMEIEITLKFLLIPFRMSVTNKTKGQCW